MALATDTPLGATYKGKEFKVLERISASLCCEYVATHRDAEVDAIMIRGGKVVSAGEIKCRSATMHQLQQWGSLMVSTSKLRAGRGLASALRVPFLIWTTVKPHLLAKRIEQMDIAYWPLIGADGEYEPAICDPDDGQLLSETRGTQDTIHGGEKIDEVTYAPVELMRLL